MLTSHDVSEVVVNDQGKRVVCKTQERYIEISFDEILLALGRQANTSGFGLEELGISLDPNHTISANEFLQTLLVLISLPMWQPTRPGMSQSMHCFHHLKNLEWIIA